MYKLDRKSVVIFFIQYFFIFSFLTIIIGSFIVPFLPIANFSLSFKFIFNYIIIYFPILLIFCYAWAELTRHFYRYELSENGFKKESGILYKRYVTIPYNKIQNVDIHRGILARLLNISELRIQTAGTSQANNSVYGDAEGVLPGISEIDAQNLRDKLIELSKK